MIAIKVPPLGESIVEGKVSRWLKNEGDRVTPGETLVELETDKITVEVPAMAGGVLKRRAHAEGDMVHVDDLLAEVDESASGGNGKEADAGATTAVTPSSSVDAQGRTTPARLPLSAVSGEFPVSPAAARAAAERGIDPST